jgi:Protein of unknown function (DUF5818)
MMFGTLHREAGRLMTSARGLILTLDDGGIFALDAEPAATALVGHRVILEGIRKGLDRLDGERVGLADANPALTRPSALSTTRVLRGW